MAGILDTTSYFSASPGSFDLGLNTLQGSSPSFSSGFGKSLLGSSGGGSSMWPLAIAGGVANIAGSFLNAGAADRSTSAARAAARDVKELEKQRMRDALQLASAQFGAEEYSKDTDFFRDFAAMKAGQDFMANSPSYARNFTRDVSSRMALAGQSPTQIALARRLFA